MNPCNKPNTPTKRTKPRKPYPRKSPGAKNCSRRWIKPARNWKRAPRPKPPTATPGPDEQINLTDPDARLMRKNKRESYPQSYNAQAVVLCCDEKSQCQTLERTQPGLPLGQWHIQTQPHDYYRHGTVALFAALNYLNGKILAQKAPQHRHQEWLKFLKHLEVETPFGVAVHLVLDNYATHKHPKVMARLKRHPRFHLHFTPTSASWLNLVERFFRDLSQDVITPGSFGSVPELVAAIWKYLGERKLNPVRYEWRADGKTILEKIQRAREALARKAHVK